MAEPSDLQYLSDITTESETYTDPDDDDFEGGISNMNAFVFRHSLHLLIANVLCR